MNNVHHNKSVRIYKYVQMKGYNHDYLIGIPAMHSDPDSCEKFIQRVLSHKNSEVLGRPRGMSHLQSDALNCFFLS